MKYLLLLTPLMLTSCTNIQYVKTQDNLLVTQDNQHVNIVGNPPVACNLVGFNRVYTGYFIYQADDGIVVLDDYGRGNIELQGDVVCKLLNETR